jgi:hypothetical protein
MTNSLTVMTEEELRLHAEHMMQAQDLSAYSYEEVVRVLTVAQYVADLCIKEIEDRGRLEWIGDAPSIPDVRPESLFVLNALTRGADGQPMWLDNT